MAMKFLQMTPENIAQANNLSWKDAWNLDKKYSYNPNYKGKGATGLGGYVKQGLGSLFGGGQTTGGVGGATPLTRKVALSPFGRVAGAAFGPLGWGAAAGQGLGMAADQYAQATNTPEAYEYMKSMGGVNSLGNFDETNLDVGDIYSEIDRLNQPQTSQPMGTDVIGMDEMNTYGQVPMGTDVIGMDEMNTYGNRDFTNVGGGGGGGNKPDVEQEEYLETPSKFQNFKSKMGDMMSGIGGMFKKLPTPMNLLTGMFKESPEQRAMMDLYNSGEYQDVLGQIPGAENLNPVYGMGAGYGLSGALGKRLAMRNSQKTQDRISKLSQQRRDKFAAQSAAIEQAISLEKAKIGARIGASGRRPGSGGGGQGTPDSGGTTGGYSYDSGGRQGYGYGLKYGGRVGYGNGGLATLFARRG
jgi:hypothetical protein